MQIIIKIKMLPPESDVEPLAVAGGVVFEAAGVVFEAAGVVFEAASVVFGAASVVFGAAGVVFGAASVVFEAAAGGGVVFGAVGVVFGAAAGGDELRSWIVHPAFRFPPCICPIEIWLKHALILSLHPSRGPGWEMMVPEVDC